MSSAESAPLALIQVITRAAVDPVYLEQLLQDPRRATAEYSLTQSQLLSITGLTRETFHEALGGVVSHWFTPMQVSKRVRVVPGWQNPATTGDQIAIRLTPGWPFGNGTHPTTQLCVRAVERYLAPRSSVVDLGTGTGLLAIVAAKLGAESVLALDVEQDAVEDARRNIELNGVQDIVTVEQGSLERALAKRAGWDLVVANLGLSLISKMLDVGLAGAVRGNGIMVLAGFREHEASRVRKALDATALVVADEDQIGDWVSIICRTVGPTKRVRGNGPSSLGGD